jgi:hypothetical protein
MAKSPSCNPRRVISAPANHVRSRHQHLHPLSPTSAGTTAGDLRLGPAARRARPSSPACERRTNRRPAIPTRQANGKGLLARGGKVFARLRGAKGLRRRTNAFSRGGAGEPEWRFGSCIRLQMAGKGPGGAQWNCLKLARLFCRHDESMRTSTGTSQLPNRR